MTTLRTDPYRALFPIGLFCGLSGIVHWLLFVTGTVPWNVPLHVALQFPAYVGCVVAGFLGTALPRITGTPPLSRLEFALFIILGVTLGAAPAFKPAWVPYVIFAVLPAALAVFIFSRHRKALRFPAPFYLAYFAVLSAGIGLLMDALSSLGFDLPGARVLWTQGFILPLVFATAPLIGRRIIGTPAVPPKFSPVIIIVPAALLAISLGLEVFDISITAAYLLRGFLVFLLIRKAEFTKLWSAGHPQPQFFLVSLICLVLGFSLAGIFADYRITFLHIAFIGGFSTLITSVAYRVVIFHGQNQDLYDRCAPAMRLMGWMLLVAAALRVCADFSGEMYLAHIAAASVLWMASHVILLGILVAAGRKRATVPAKVHTMDLGDLKGAPAR